MKAAASFQYWWKDTSHATQNNLQNKPGNAQYVINFIVTIQETVHFRSIHIQEEWMVRVNDPNAICTVSLNKKLTNNKLNLTALFDN